MSPITTTLRLQQKKLKWNENVVNLWETRKRTMRVHVWSMSSVSNAIVMISMTEGECMVKKYNGWTTTGGHRKPVVHTCSYFGGGGGVGVGVGVGGGGRQVLDAQRVSPTKWQSTQRFSEGICKNGAEKILFLSISFRFIFIYPSSFFYSFFNFILLM